MTNKPFPLTEEQLAKRIFLAVKIAHLAGEPAIIKRHMRRLKKARVRFAARREGSNVPFVGGWAVHELRQHHVKVVRPEARAALVAYGYLRGRDYSQVECNAKRPPNWIRVAELVIKYGDLPYGTTKVEAERLLLDWRDRSIKPEAIKAA